MRTSTVIAGLVGLSAIGASGHELPHRARGGLAHQLHLERNTQAPQVDTQWFNQTIDHSDPSVGTFQQRYYIVDDFASGPDAPVFLYIGGEGPQDGPGSGWINDLAEQFGARTATLEHRYYGESVPNGNLETENLKHLTVQNALADLASFTDWYTETELGGNSGPWVAFGGSYPGALSSWYRAEYPDKTVASLSSSGVVNSIFEYWQFDDQIAISAGDECADVLRRTTAAFEDQWDSGHGDDIRAAMNATGLTIKPDFFYMIADSMSMAVQYGMKNQLCEPMIEADKSGDPADLITAFAGVTSHVWGASFGSDCFYDTNCLINDPDRWQPTARSWRWQKCQGGWGWEAEGGLAYLQNAPKEGSIRSASVDMDALVTQCKTVFGDSTDPEGGTETMNKHFGGGKPHAKKVYYSNGSDDPWQRASIDPTMSDDPEQPAFLAECDLCGHCGDLHSPSESDPANLQKQRAEFVEYLTEWLSTGQQ